MTGGDMAACGAMIPRLAVRRVRTLCHDFPAPVPAQCRSVHSWPALCAKSYLYKFTNKKKKHWYDSAVYLLPEKKPSGLQALLKHQPVAKRENNTRIKVLNGVLYNALVNLLNTSEVSEEVYDFCIELSKVSVPADFSVCRAYWLSSGSKETDDEIEKVLQKYAPRFRHLMISHHVLGNVPPVVFVRDKEDAKRRQVEDLLASLQIEEADLSSSVPINKSRQLDIQSVQDSSDGQVPSIFGIDHAELNQQIFTYKKKMKAMVTETNSSEHSERQQEQLAAIRKQNLQRKKMKARNEKKLKASAYISPHDYQLLSAMNSDPQEELDFEGHEDLVESNEDLVESNEDLVESNEDLVESDEEDQNSENTRK